MREQAALADGPDDRVRIVPAHHRKLRHPVLVQQGHGVAHLVVRAHAHERRHFAALVLAPEHLAHRLLTCAVEQPVLGHPGVVEDLRQIVAPAVRQDHGHHRLGIVDPARHLQRGPHRHAARAAHQQALLGRQPAGGEERVAVGNGHVAVDHARVESARPEVLPHALDQVRLDLLVRVDRAHRVSADHLDGRVALLQIAAGAGDRAARAHAHHQVRYAPAALLPQLRAGAVVVRLGVGRVEVLVGLEGAGDLLGQPICHAVVGLRRVGRHVGGRHHHLGAIRPQEIDLLLGHLVRHHRDHAVALQPRRDRETGARVARGGLHDRAAGLEAAIPLRGFDQPQRHPVLDRAARVERLHLRHKVRPESGSHPAEADKRRAADRLQNRVLDVRRGGVCERRHELNSGSRSVDSSTTRSKFGDLKDSLSLLPPRL